MCIHKTDDGKCQKFSDEQFTSYCVDGPCPDDMPTNADRIRAMGDEELSKWLIRLSEGDKDIKFCVDRPECDADLEQDREIPQERCAECLLSWLSQPYGEGAT